MSENYSDPSRENDPYALPDVEIFYADGPEGDFEPGWYWWPCFPGCLPDGDPMGPFDSEEEALADARGDS
jgi:hypothetical protein